MIPKIRAPLVLVWEITDSCNLGCVHCRTACDGISEIRRNPSVERSLIEYIARERVFVVNLSGGEPLLHPEVVSIVERLVAAGAQVGVSTNGFLWPTHGQELVDAGLAYVQISVDGPRQLHNRIRGNPRAYDAAIEALKAARGMGVRTQMNTVLSTLNTEHLDEIYALAGTLAVGLHVRRFIPTGTGGSNRHLIPGPAEHMDLLRTLLSLRQRGEVDMEIEAPLTALLLDESDRPQLGCGAGSTQIGVSMNGDVFPCIFLRTPVGNLLETDLSTLWGSSPLFTSLRARDTPTCRSCDLADSCGGCRACAPTPFSDDPLCPRVEQTAPAT